MTVDFSAPTLRQAQDELSPQGTQRSQGDNYSLNTRIHIPEPRSP